MSKTNIERGDRFYNGLPSNLMNDIYDQLEARGMQFEKAEYWPLFSLFLARACSTLERNKNAKKKKRNK